MAVWWPLVFVGSLILGGVSRGIRERKGPNLNADDIKYPTASEQTPIPVAFGKVWLERPNVLWFGDAAIEKISTPPEQAGNPVTGFYWAGGAIEYSIRMGLWIGLCHSGIYKISGIKYGGKVLNWGSTYTAGDINFPYADEKAGIDWYVTVNEGRAAQDDRIYYAENGGPYDGLGLAQAPQHIGTVSLWFQSSDEIAYPGVEKGAKWSSTTTQLEALAFQVIRRPCDAYAENTWESGSCYTDLVGANPAHCLYELITSTQYGLGFSTGSIDTVSFAAAAATLVTENIGLNFVLENADERKAGDVIRDILGLIDGILYIGKSDGLFHLVLLRDDYVIGDLTELDESNTVSLDDVARPALAESANEIVATCTDFDGNKKSISVQDLAAIQAIGTTISGSLDLSMIGNLGAANQIATRELKKAGLYLVSCTATVDRAAAADLEIGDCVKVTWPDYGLSTVVFRILGIDWGSLTDGNVKLTLTQDAYSLPDSIYSDPGDTGWTDPINDAQDATDYLLMEAPYQIVARAYPSMFWQLASGYAGTTAAIQTVCYGRPTLDHTRFDVAVEASGSYLIDGGARSTPWIDISGTIGQTDTSLAYSDADGLAGVDVGTNGVLGLITNETTITGLAVDIYDAEVVLVTNLGIGSGVCTVKRGIFDTTAWPHGSGARLWLIQENQQSYGSVQAILRSLYFKAIAYDWKLLGSTSRGRLDLASATTHSWLANSFLYRFFRPYAPGKFYTNGEEFPTYVTGDLVFTWEHRNRADQLDYSAIVEQDDTGFTAPTDIEYAIVIAGNGGFPAGYSVIIKDDLDATHTWTEANEIAAFGSLQSTLYVAIYSRLSAFPLYKSWRPQYRVLTRVGFGMGFGYSFGGL